MTIVDATGHWLHLSIYLILSQWLSKPSNPKIALYCFYSIIITTISYMFRCLEITKHSFSFTVSSVIVYGHNEADRTEKELGAKTRNLHCLISQITPFISRLKFWK